MQLYIIRHGQSTNNALADIKNRIEDPRLTELGRQQAVFVANYLATATQTAYSLNDIKDNTITHTVEKYGITHLYCSAMYRAMLTAQPVGEALGLNPEVWIDIHESGGVYLDHNGRGSVGYTGKTRPEILAEFSNYVLPKAITDNGWWNVNLGREDWPACQGRAIRVANKLLNRGDSDDHIALITHGGFIDALIKALTNQLPGENIFYHHFNTAITRIDFNDNGHRDIRYINQVIHLPQEMMS